LAVLVSTLGLGGCAGFSSPWWDSMQALVATGGTGVAKSAIPAMPDLRYNYLRVEVEGHPPAMLVLGYLAPHPLGQIEVWYSGNRETIRTQNGRVVGSTGTVHDWHAVGFTPIPPAWSELPVQGATYNRKRDTMPGYRFGITEQIQLSAWQGLPPLKLPESLPPAKAQQYRWYRESATVVQGQGAAALPDAWFAWGMHRGVESIVYSEQCLAPDFCLKLQLWPLLEEAK
jgi:hypothetical protein